MGRPSSYTPEMAAQICERLAAGESLRSICRIEGMPCQAMVYRWLENNESFREQYAQARNDGLEALADEIFDIADESRNDWVERENARTGRKETTLNDEAIQRSRLRVDARKWYLSKVAPKKYGDRQEVHHSGSVDIASSILDARKRAGS